MAEIYKKILKLNLPSFNHRLLNENGRLLITDIITKNKLILTPEEWVRQHFINYLISVKNVPAVYMARESGLKYNRLLKRTDILVFSTGMKPLLLVECKAPHIAPGKRTLYQAGLYNSKINAPLLALTNGMVHFYWQMSPGGGLIPVQDLPCWTEMQAFIQEAAH